MNKTVYTLFGIPNCDTCKKARKWLESNDITYQFHDVRVDGLTREDVKRWLNSVEWKTLLNTRSTTWRNLDDGIRAKVDEKNVVNLLIEHPTLVKRPVLERSATITVGFSNETYAKIVQ